jgi:hypothetical protein
MSTMTTISRSRSAVVLGLGLFVLPGCPLLDVEIDAEEICLTYPNFQVPALPGGQTSLSQSFVFDDLSAIKEIAELDSSLEFVRAEIRATSGIAGFDFVHAVRIVVSSGDPESELPPMTMYDCDGDCAPEVNRLEIPAAAGADAIAYLRSDSIKIDLSFEGEVPMVAWTMDLDVCMKARARYTVSP